MATTTVHLPPHHHPVFVFFVITTAACALYGLPGLAFARSIRRRLLDVNRWKLVRQVAFRMVGIALFVFVSAVFWLMLCDWGYQHWGWSASWYRGGADRHYFLSYFVIAIIAFPPGLLIGCILTWMVHRRASIATVNSVAEVFE